MAHLETRIKKLETQLSPSELSELVIFLISTPAVNGRVCPEYQKRGVQTGQCGDRTFKREPNETESAFHSRIIEAVKIQGRVAVAMLK